MNNNLTYTGPSVTHGTGVFLHSWVASGTIIEICTAFPFPDDQEPVPNHQLYWDDTRNAIATGNVMLYNHSDMPNVVFINDLARNLIFVKATNYIPAGSELFKYYKCGKWW